MTMISLRAIGYVYSPLFFWDRFIFLLFLSFTQVWSPCYPCAVLPTFQLKRHSCKPTQLVIGTAKSLFTVACIHFSLAVHKMSVLCTKYCNFSQDARAFSHVRKVARVTNKDVIQLLVIGAEAMQDACSPGRHNGCRLFGKYRLNHFFGDHTVNFSCSELHCSGSCLITAKETDHILSLIMSMCCLETSIDPCCPSHSLSISLNKSKSI